MVDEDDKFSLDKIIALIGMHAVLRMCQEYAGRRLYIPHVQGLSSRRSSRLVTAIGLDAAVKMAENWGGEYISSVPVRPLKRSLVWKMKDEGHSVSYIARDMMVTERWVYQTLSYPRPQPSTQTAPPDLPPLLSMMGVSHER